MKKKLLLCMLSLAMMLSDSSFVYAASQDVNQKQEQETEQSVEKKQQQNAKSSAGQSVLQNEEQDNNRQSLQSQGEEDTPTVSSDWFIESVTTDLNSPQQINSDVKYTVNMGGTQNTDVLEYKYVWMKNDWKQWGVIKEFSNDNTCNWTPSEKGDYKIYIDVKDANGKKANKICDYKITKAIWDFRNITSDVSFPQKPNQNITFTANAEGNTKNLQYKFVWMKDNWKDWGVISSFSDLNSCSYSFDKAGEYYVYADIYDPSEKITKTKKLQCNCFDYVWDYSVTTSLPSPQEKYGDPITIKAETSGENEDLQYKFVWSKNNWEQWGVIQKTSDKNEAVWEPKDTGEYQLYVDVTDKSGRVSTKTISYSITKVKWNLDSVDTSPTQIAKKGTTCEITVNTSGTTKSLKYKYVWMKDNWKDWGVIQGFSESNTAEWKTPNQAGKYKIYVDVQGRDRETVTRVEDYFVASQIWTIDGVNINDNQAEQVYTHIPVSATTSGETDGLKYKFVWKYGSQDEGWAGGWGVINDYSTSNSTNKWYPKKAGVYTIYTDVVDKDGRSQTLKTEYTVSEAPWKFEGFDTTGGTSHYTGESADVVAKTSGENSDLKYKFVVRRGNDWSDWEVVQDFSSNNQISVNIDKNIAYTVYVDICDSRGVVFDAYTYTLGGYIYPSAGASSYKVSLGKSVDLYPNIYGPGGCEAQYKYVWQKDNWSSWNVLSDKMWNSRQSWTPSEVGNYTIYIDVTINGVKKTQTIQISVVKEKNGWYYEDGYKFYYQNDRRLTDVRNIIGWQPSYYAMVNRQACTVTMYAKDGGNGYIIPVCAFACSVGKSGTPTPSGTFYTSNKYRWHTLMGPSYGQYCTRITGGVLFHSVAGYNMTPYNIRASAYNMLGSPASHGCVRLCVRDAKWIYDNCSSGMRVTIYDSGWPGPMGKPNTIKIPSWQNWDPTDPGV